MRVLILGGGIFGATAARAFAARGVTVTLADPGPLPHPLAESTDISKIVRADYGADEGYAALGEAALDGWRRWNRAWPAPRFHETGVAFLCRAPMAPGGYEHDSFALLTRRGHALERLDAGAIARRFPALGNGAHVDGYWNPTGGWAESGAVVADLIAQAIALGVTVRAGAAIGGLVDEGSRVVGATIDEAIVRADLVLVCAGAWTTALLPELAGALRATGQPVFHLAPADPAPFASPRFPVLGADLARTGWYGFPLTQGVVKLANHGVGVALPADAPPAQRVVRDPDEAALRAFLAAAIPALADAPIVARRLCVYGDSADGHFWIARHPDRPGLAVAAGGSGHAFKFAPVLGDLIADLVTGGDHPLAARFRWRPAPRAIRSEEQARCTGDDHATG